MKHVAIVTSEEPKPWYPDIDLLVAALGRLGVEAQEVVWNDKQIDWERYDRIFIDSVWDYTEKYEDFFRWAEQASVRSKLINPLDIVRGNSDKSYLLRLQDSGIPVPFTTLVKAGSTIDCELASKYDRGVVVKPAIGADGVGAYRFDDFYTMQASEVAQVLVAEGDLLIQDYQKEIHTLGEYGAIFIGGELSHCVHKQPGSNDFRVQFEYGGTTKLTTAPEYLDEYYRKIISVLDCNPAYMRLDFIPSLEPIIMEVEMIEPNKYFALFPEGADTLARCIQ